MTFCIKKWLSDAHKFSRLQVHVLLSKSKCIIRVIYHVVSHPIQIRFVIHGYYNNTS